MPGALQNAPRHTKTMLAGNPSELVRGKTMGAHWHRLTLVALVSSLLLPARLAGQTDSAAIALVKSGHWKRARPLIEREYQSNPNSAEVAWLLSQVKLAFGDLDPALTLAEKAVAMEGKNSDYHYQLAVVCGRTAEKASLFSKGHWAKRFKEEAETAATLDAKNLDARFGLLEYYLQAPRLMGGGKDKARAMADEIARIDSISGDLAHARVAQDQKDRASEQAFLAKAVAAEPKTYHDLVSVADFYLPPAAAAESTGARTVGAVPADAATVEKLAREAATLAPDRAEAYAMLARLYAEEKKWRELETVLNESEKHVPDNLAPYYHAARVLSAQSAEGSEDLARSEGYFRKYLSQSPEPDSPSRAEAHWQLGLVLEKQGRKGQATAEIEAGLSMDPNLAQAKIDLKRIQGEN
jgi:tetratricopeptide (TPR) repeat protein